MAQSIVLLNKVSQYWRHAWHGLNQPHAPTLVLYTAHANERSATIAMITTGSGTLLSCSALPKIAFVFQRTGRHGSAEGSSGKACKQHSRCAFATFHSITITCSDPIIVCSTSTHHLIHCSFTLCNCCDPNILTSSNDLQFIQSIAMARYLALGLLALSGVAFGSDGCHFDGEFIRLQFKQNGTDTVTH